MSNDHPTTVTVKTTGDFMFLDPISGYEIPHEGADAALVPLTPFVQERINSGLIAGFADAAAPSAEPPRSSSRAKASARGS